MVLSGWNCKATTVKGSIWSAGSADVSNNLYREQRESSNLNKENSYFLKSDVTKLKAASAQDRQRQGAHRMSGPQITQSMWPVQEVKSGTPRHATRGDAHTHARADRERQRRPERHATSRCIINILWLTIITSAQTRTTDSFLSSACRFPFGKHQVLNSTLEARVWLSLKTWAFHFNYFATNGSSNH